MQTSPSAVTHCFEAQAVVSSGVFGATGGSREQRRLLYHPQFAVSASLRCKNGKAVSLRSPHGLGPF